MPAYNSDKTRSKFIKEMKIICVSLFIFLTSTYSLAKELSVTYPVRHISVSINNNPETVYSFASKPENLPKWAQGLSGTKLVKSGDEWIADSPMGKVKVRFAPENKLGVLDHDVTVSGGKVFHNPLRILKNNDGSEVVFTLYRMPEMSEKEFEKDADQVLKDLYKLKMLLEE